MDIPTHDELVARIDAFLERHDLTDSSFSRAATGEPGLVARIREGSSPTLKILNRLAEFMAAKDAQAAAAPDRDAA
jgi:hypothetical protein